MTLPNHDGFIVLGAMLCLFSLVIMLFSSIQSSIGQSRNIQYLPSNPSQIIPYLAKITLYKRPSNMQTPSGSQTITKGIGSNFSKSTQELSKIDRTIDNKLAQLSSDVKTLNGLLSNSTLRLDKDLQTLSANSLHDQLWRQNQTYWLVNQPCYQMTDLRFFRDQLSSIKRKMAYSSLLDTKVKVDIA